MPRIAAIDFGFKRIGIAVSDERQILAFPFKVVDGGSRAVENVANALKPKISEIEKILVGLPLLMSGERGDMADVVEKFAKQLEAKLNITVELCDERLS